MLEKGDIGKSVAVVPIKFYLHTFLVHDRMEWVNMDAQIVYIPTLPSPIARVYTSLDP